MKKAKTMKSYLSLLVFFLLLLLLHNAEAEIVVLSDETGQWRLEQYITTHFTKTSGDYRFGGEIEDGYLNPYYGKDPDLRWGNQYKDGHPSDDAIRPGYDNYNNQITAYNAVAVKPDGSNDKNNNGIADEIELLEKGVFRKTGRHVDILNYNPRVRVRDYVFEDHENIQIINNIIRGTTLFTVFLPPHWRKNPQEKYPVLLTGLGFGSDNNAMYLQTNTFLASIVGKSIDFGPGLIAIQSNCGGRESLGINSNAWDDLNSFLVSTMSKYGADINRIVTRGGSRAGNTSLNWGANPKGYNYNAVAIYAFVPPLKIGSMAKLPFATFPALTDSVNKILGSKNAYSYYYRDLDTPDNDILSPEDKAIMVSHVLLGSNSIEEADQNSAYGNYSNPLLTESLQEKRILISQGTHDAWMPMPYLLDFDNMLRDKQIPHTTFIGYGGYGHGYKENEKDFEKTLIKLLVGEEVAPHDGGRRFYMPEGLINEGNGTETRGNVFITDFLINNTILEYRPYYFAEDHNCKRLAFSAAIPCRVGQDLPLAVALIGEKGKSWEIWVRKEDGYRHVYRNNGIFGEDPNNPGSSTKHEYGDEYVVLNLRASVEPGRYEWFFKYDEREIPNRFTPFVSTDGHPVKALTEVTENEPVREDYFYEFSSNYGINFGVDQYHPLLLRENHDPHIFTIEGFGFEVNAGELLEFTVGAVDLDQEDKGHLVYDIRHANSGNLVGKIDFNGLSGEFSYLAQAEDIGTYHLKAIAKDGKGGIAERKFTITVDPAFTEDGQASLE